MCKINKFIFFVIFSCFLSSCNSAKQTIIDEISEKDENVLYSEAMQNYNKGYFKTAGDSFEKIESTFIFTPLATKSIIMGISSYYKAKKYDDSLRLIEYYKKINFSNDYLDYVLYMEILNKYAKSMKNKKDLTLMNDLYLNIEYMIKNYSNSIYVEDVLLKKEKVINSIIKNELIINDFYINNNNFIGSINHLSKILEQFNNSSYNAEIYYKLIMLYKYINYKEGVDKYYNMLKNNYSESKWYKYANK